ncbi:hypothetical protein BWQ96_10026 [Gracilariopsis chorda]|uniref:Uncharacterized protein n=1 Tax=Gracilariopsis chorda TaxID=448386 RepID=A0A2V3IDW9_9FLOR|nr:hypothetical protein BWQ96_10026 [Gracilariopsis chorda]|eukprot:PXF40264.1 hypothetical protein BWQ96_10026 [Gracilariopsis chorda]
MQPTSEHRPSPVPGETVLSTWPNTKFFLSTTETSTWASLAAFHGVGTLRLTTCRLLFTVTPPSSSRAHLSIPLAWLRPEKLHIRRPFFDNKHISGLLTPCELHTPDPIFRFSKSMEFRLELLDVQVYDTLFFALRDLIADPQRLALHTRALRAQVDEKLVPTGNHFAFVDPTDPRYLHLATQMMHPTLP